jgi:hypothetical protein
MTDKRCIYFIIEKDNYFEIFYVKFDKENENYTRVYVCGRFTYHLTSMKLSIYDHQKLKIFLTIRSMPYSTKNREFIVIYLEIARHEDIIV